MKKTPSPTFFIILTVASLAVWGVFVYWQYKNTSQTYSKVASMKKELAEASQLPAQVIKSHEMLQAAMQELTHLETGVSTAAYVPTLLKELQSTGEQCGLAITGVRPVPKAPPKQKKGQSAEAKPARKPYEELDVEVKCRGSFSATMTFLQKLADFPKIVGVRHMSLDPKTAADSLTLEGIESTITMRVYVFSTAQESSEESAKATQGVHS